MTLPLAPVALFVYRRTRHLTKTLDRLERCDGFSQSPVFIFSDGPRPGAEADVAAVRSLVAARQTPNMTVIESAANLGLANSIIAGVGQLCDRFGRVIVIEDDLLASPALLTWFNRALENYADAAQVWQVSAHQFAVPAFRRRQSGMFLNFATSWGWATWKRAWDQFDTEAHGWQSLAQDAGLRARFDFGGAYPYADMLERQMAGEVDSWAVRWWWSMFRAGALGLFPPRSMVTNIGEDDTATHAPSRLGRLLRPLHTVMDTAPTFPPTVTLDAAAQSAIQDFLRTRARKFQWARGAWNSLRGAVT